jgi:glycine hydroxymethyltransferase
MGEEEMKLIARLVADVLQAPEDESVKQRVKQQVKELTARFPLYANRLQSIGANAD